MLKMQSAESSLIYVPWGQNLCEVEFEISIPFGMCLHHSQLETSLLMIKVWVFLRTKTCLFISLIFSKGECYSEVPNKRVLSLKTKNTT